jgi:hypothetical protein
MADNVAATPYESARAVFGSGIPTWLNALDAARLAAYTLYENIYWNNPDTFKLVLRGTNEQPIYVPSGKIICNTMNRYVARGYDVIPDTTAGVQADQDSLAAVFKQLFKRERFFSRFKINRLYGIIRGDAMWYVTANANKPPGSRLSVRPIDPGTVFWITDEAEEEKLGVDIVQQVVNDDGSLYVKRQRYLLSTHPDHPNYTEDDLGEPTNVGGDIVYQMDSFQVQDWEDPAKRKKFTEGPSVPQTIIPGIISLPVYGYTNQEDTESLYGFSELRGLETIIAGVNQAASDQDLALAITGLGQYVTNAGPPVDDDGNDVPWGLGPAEVIEVGDGKDFKRINGITTVDPSLSHINFLQEQAFRTSGASDVAQGQVEVNLAESGIALQLRMGPILDSASDKDVFLGETMDRLYFDLTHQWLPVYEGFDVGDYDPADPNAVPAMVSKFGDKLPEDKAARIKVLMDGYNAIPAIFSGAFVRAEMRRMGIDVPPDADIQQQIAEEAAFFSDATSAGGAADPTGNRLEQEAGGGPGGDNAA